MFMKVFIVIPSVFAQKNINHLVLATFQNCNAVLNLTTVGAISEVWVLLQLQCTPCNEWYGWSCLQQLDNFN